MQRRRQNSRRLTGYDYSQAGSYFVTCCSQNRRCLFGQMRGGKMVLSPLGQIVMNTWNSLPQRFPGITLDEFIVMPDHIHGIIHIKWIRPTWANKKEAFQILETEALTRLGTIVGALKSVSAVECLRYYQRHSPEQYLGKVWQRNYHDWIIRTPAMLNRVRQYIRDNPKKAALNQPDGQSPNQNQNINR